VPRANVCECSEAEVGRDGVCPVGVRTPTNQVAFKREFNGVGNVFLVPSLTSCNERSGAEAGMWEIVERNDRLEPYSVENGLSKPKQLSWDKGRSAVSLVNVNDRVA